MVLWCNFNLLVAPCETWHMSSPCYSLILISLNITLKSTRFPPTILKQPIDSLESDVVAEETLPTNAA